MLKFNHIQNGDGTRSMREKKNSEKKADQKQNVRKYVNYGLLMVAIILAAFIVSKLYTMYQDNKLGESIFERMVGNIQYNDVDSAVSELPSDGFILISYVKNPEVKKFEAALKKSVVNNELQSNFYYMDATDLMMEDGYLDSINDKFKLSDQHKLKGLPAIIYYNDGVVKTSISSTSERMLNVDDFNKMLDSYEILEKK